MGTDVNSVNGNYISTSADQIPPGFDQVMIHYIIIIKKHLFLQVCKQQGWPTSKMWNKLNCGKTWFRAENEAYIYWNSLDSCWWIDKVK